MTKIKLAILNPQVDLKPGSPTLPPLSQPRDSKDTVTDEDPDVEDSSREDFTEYLINRFFGLLLEVNAVANDEVKKLIHNFIEEEKEVFGLDEGEDVEDDKENEYILTIRFE